MIAAVARSLIRPRSVAIHGNRPVYFAAEEHRIVVTGVDIVADEGHVKFARGGTFGITEFQQKHPAERLDLSGADLSNVTLSSAKLSGANLSDARLSRANLTGADLTDANLEGADLCDAKLTGANLTGANLATANLTGADLSEVTLSRTNLTRAILSQANVRKIRISATSMFEDSSTAGMRVDRRSAVQLREVLSIGQQMDLRIVDDVVALRNEFSGIWRFLHWVSGVLFLSPYLIFFWKMCEASSERSYVVGRPLHRIFVQYVWNGGVDWGGPWNLNRATCYPAVFFVVYSILRMTMFVKWKKLETLEAATGLPASFSFTERVWQSLQFPAWQILWIAVRVGYWWALLAVFWHSVAFTATRRVYGFVW